MSSRSRTWLVTITLLPFVCAMSVMAATAAASPASGASSARTWAGATPTASAAAPPEAVRLALGFVWQPQFLPVLYGINKGYFREQGIQLTVQATSGPTQSLQLLEAGQVEFALPTFQEYALARSLNQSSGKSVYTYMPQPNLGIVSRVPITTPAGLVGKTYATTAASSSDLVLKGLMRDAGLNPDTLTVKKLDFAVLYPSLLQGTIDIAEGSTPGSWRALQRTAERAGINLFQVPMTDWGMKGLGRILIAPDNTIARKPGLVRRMVAAMHKSLVAARAELKGPAAAELLATQVQVSDPVAQARDWEDFVALTGGAGPAEGSAVTATLNFLRGGNFIPRARPVQDYYTNLFVPASVRGNKPPTLRVLSLNRSKNQITARVRICDDAKGTLTVVVRTAKSRVLPATRRFSARLRGACGTFSERWQLESRFAKPGQLTFTIQARDSARRAGNEVRKVVRGT